MLIGELSNRTGFSHDTIRFYEKKRLITINRRERRQNNYKEYPEVVYERLMLIKTVKALGFTLNETGEFIQAWGDESASFNNLINHLTDKIHRVDEQIRLLQEIKNELTISLEKCRADNCELEKMIPSCIGKC
ncbi:MAG TPA: MerR family DNA-binding protein [Cyclobacteriaceae bacterium]|nr:MerR family DNA-binding protein [Cyclobacteriaceae bacterium]